MPSTPYAKLLVSLNAGPPQSGGVTALNGDAVQFTAESTVGWDLTTPPRWEIYAYPPGWTGPAAGWTTESVASPFGGTYDVYVFTGLGPPPAFTLPALPMWGDFLCKLTVAGGLLNGLPAAQLIDNATALRIVGPGGLTDIAVSAEAQFDTGRAWVGSWQDVLRILDAALVGAATPYAALPEPVQIGAGSAGVVLQYAHGDHSHPVTVGAPTTIAIGDAAAAGGGTALAGAAHVHALPVPTVVSNVSSGASALGASTAVAREDHAHQLTFTTLNTILGTASAPIDVNGQTVTSGGFLAPYFSTTAVVPASTGLLRAATRTDAVVFRNELDTGDIRAVWMDGTGIDDLIYGDTTANSTTIKVKIAGDILLSTNATFLRLTTTGTRYDKTATFSITQDTSAVGAGSDGTIQAQGGAATFNGGNLVLKSGVRGAGGSPGEIRLDANDGATVSGAIAMRGGAFGEFLRFSFDNAANRTTMEATADFMRLDPKTFELPATNAVIFASTGDYGSGTGVLAVANAGVEPGNIATGYHGVYAFADALKARGKALTVLAPVVESAAGSEDLRAPDRRAKRFQTTDAVQQTAYTFAVPDNSSSYFEIIVTAKTVGGADAAVYKIKGGVKRHAAGVATLIGAVDVFAREDNVALDATANVDGGNNLVVLVTGAATMEWFITPNVTLMAPV